LGRKPATRAQVLTLNFIEKINLEQNVFISEVRKAFPNLQRLSFEKCSSRLLNNKNLEALLGECPNLKSLTIIGSDRLSLKTIAKNPQLCPSLKILETKDCRRK